MGATIPIEGGALTYEAAGTGAPIVFIAGLGGYGSYWKAQFQACLLYTSDAADE